MSRRIDKRELRRLAAEGLAQRQIARHFGVSQAAVGAMCRLLGVATHGNAPERRSANGRAASKKRGDRRVPFAVEAAKLGWPQALTPKAARLLEALSGGPRTLQDVYGRRELSCRDYACVNALLGLGLVERVSGVRPYGRKHCGLWRLAPGVARQNNTVAEKRLREQTYREPRLRGRVVAG